MKLPFQRSSGDDSDASLVDTLLKFLSPLLVVVTLGGLYAWQIDDVRIESIEHLEVLGQQAAINALSDTSPKVAKQACAAIIDHKIAFQHPEILSKLSQRPEVALACLEESIGDQTRIEELKPHDRVVAHRLGHLWHERLMTAEVEGEEMSCEITGYIAKAIALSDWSSEDMLLDCAVSAKSEGPRRCCEQAFQDEQLAEMLDNPEWFELEYAVERLPVHTAVSFGFALPKQAPSDQDQSDQSESDQSESNKDQSDKHTADGEEPDALQANSNLDSAELQDWAVAQGCRVLHTEADGYTSITSFEPVFDTPTCHDSQQTPRGYYDKSNWLAVCENLYDVQRSQGQPPAKALCNSLEQATVNQAIASAQTQVSIANSVPIPGVGEQFQFAPPSAAFAAKPLNLGGRGAAAQRSSASSPVMRNFFSQLIPGL